MLTFQRTLRVGLRKALTGANLQELLMVCNATSLLLVIWRYVCALLQHYQVYALTMRL